MEVSMTLREIFGERVRFFRKRQGLLQTDMPGLLAEAGYRAAEGGPSGSQVSLVERGQAAVSLEMIFSYAQALGVAPIALLIPEAEADEAALPSGEIVRGDMLAAWLIGHSALPSAGAEEEIWDRIVASVPLWASWRKLSERAHEQIADLKADLADAYGRLALARLEASEARSEREAVDATL
jgi:transcriptional regulator with XRE-family HTH domain